MPDFNPFDDPKLQRQIMWKVFGFVLPDALPSTPARLVEAQAAMRGEMDTTSPIDPFEYPVELIWGRLPASARGEQLGLEIENALYRIYYGRAFFYVHWAPLRAFQMWFVEGGGVKIEEPKVSRTQELANTGAAIIAASTVIERCLDIAAQAGRFYLEEPLRLRPDHQPIESVDKARLVLQRLHDVDDLERKVLRYGGGQPVLVEAVRNALKQLGQDPFPLIDLHEGVVPNRRSCSSASTYVGSRSEIRTSLSCQQQPSGSFANSLGGACSEWSAIAAAMTPYRRFL